MTTPEPPTGEQLHGNDQPYPSPVQQQGKNPLLIAAAIFLPLLFLAGIGTVIFVFFLSDDDDDTSTGTPEAVIESYVHAMNEGSFGTIAELSCTEDLDNSYVKGLSRISFDVDYDVIRKKKKELDLYEKAYLVYVSVTGTAANGDETEKYDEEVRPVPLVLEDNQWRVCFTAKGV